MIKCFPHFSLKNQFKVFKNFLTEKYHFYEKLLEKSFYGLKLQVESLKMLEKSFFHRGHTENSFCGKNVLEN